MRVVQLSVKCQKACCLWEKQSPSLPAKATTSFVQEETSSREINWPVRWLIWNCQLRIASTSVFYDRFNWFCVTQTCRMCPQTYIIYSYLIVLPNLVWQVKSFFFINSISIPLRRRSFSSAQYRFRDLVISHLRSRELMLHVYRLQTKWSVWLGHQLYCGYLYVIHYF